MFSRNSTIVDKCFQEPVLWIAAAAVRQRTDCNLTSASFWNSQISNYVIGSSPRARPSNWVNSALYRCMIVTVSLQNPHKCVVKSLVKIAAVSWHSLRRFIKPVPALYRHRIKHIEMILVQWEKASNVMFWLTFGHRARKIYVHLWFWQSRLSINKPFRDYYGTQPFVLSPFDHCCQY